MQTRDEGARDIALSMIIRHVNSIIWSTNAAYPFGAVYVQSGSTPGDLTVSGMQKFYEIVVAPHLILQMFGLNHSDRA